MGTIARGVALGSARLRCGLLLLVAGLGACRSSEDALLRGDRYWADSNYVAALAEYRLAARQHEDPAVEARVAHAYALTGQLDRARRTYDELLKTESSYADQAIFDYVSLANSNLERGDRYGAARAAEAALLLRPGLALPEMALTLARHYATIGDSDRALQFYHRALATADHRTRGALLYEIASINERSGHCIEALPYFRSFSEESSSQDSVTEARWRMGTCGLERGRAALAAGKPESALELLQVTLDLGAPQNLLDEAWFHRGEALTALGRLDEAQVAYERVLELTPAGRSQLATRASRRLDEIRARPIP
ncbi:MAG TPA: tetratricopeptide repeat protein [Longimicrobiales bacterium]